MGIFNMFIVIPQIVAAVGGVNFVSGLLGEQAINAMTVCWYKFNYSSFSKFFNNKSKRYNLSIS